MERSQITKSILVIDEAQDMSADEFALVEMLINLNEDMRVIAVGDDDQNIYEFRGSDSGYMRRLIAMGATVYNMTENFRSSDEVIAAANAFVTSIPYRLKAVPIKGVQDSRGNVNVRFHRAFNYEQAIVNEIVTDDYDGRTSVLALTNDDALILSALLNRHGRKTRLIQSKEGFSLTDLAELHFFLSLVRKPGCIDIDESEWEKAKAALREQYSDSQYLEVALNCIAGFESEGKHLYLSDFESYLRESQLETFIPGGDSEIIVSTIHKAKGREFDNVYVSLKGLRVITDKERRAVYVAMTRAKKNLSIHYDNPALFDRNVLSAVNYAMDETDYGQPAEILIQMGHKDVYLNDFINKRIDFAAIHSGCVLNVGYDGLYLGFTRVVKFSGAFTQKLQTLGAKGYIPSSAKVRVQVFWHHEDKEVTPPKWHHDLILLPDMVLTMKTPKA